MDRKDPMTMSGSPSYYLQRGLSELGGQHVINPVSNPNMSFQSNVAGLSSQTLMVDPRTPTTTITTTTTTNSAILPDGMNVTASSMQLSSEPMKRKRGRPRKYGTHGPVSLALLPSSSNSQGMSSPVQKRGRGRPSGTGRKQQSAAIGQIRSDSAGMGFTPHVITIAPGEDIAASIIAFAQQRSTAVCVMSANGAVSTVTLRQQSSSGGIVTFEGWFDILCLSGSLLLIDNDGSRERAGGLSISLASPDGRIIGGRVGGMLIAASPVQVILGTFVWRGSTPKNNLTQGSEVAGSKDHHHSTDNRLARASMQHGQTGTSSMVAWPSPPHGVDMENTPPNIDLMRG